MPAEAFVGKPTGFAGPMQVPGSRTRAWNKNNNRYNEPGLTSITCIPPEAGQDSLAPSGGAEPLSRGISGARKQNQAQSNLPAPEKAVKRSPNSVRNSG